MFSKQHTNHTNHTNPIYNVCDMLNRYDSNGEPNLYSLFEPLFEPYMDEIFENQEYIEIKEKDKTEPTRIYKSDITKITKAIIEYQIIIRNKSFSNQMIQIIHLFQEYEKERLDFVSQIKSLNLSLLLEYIDEKYIESYQSGKSNVFVPMCNGAIGLPRLNLYNYLMTFERHRCTFHLSDNNMLLIHYHKDSERNYFIYELSDKILYQKRRDLYKSRKDITLRYGACMIDNDKYLNMKVDTIVNNITLNKSYEVGLYKCDVFFGKYESIHVERAYVECIFGYHELNFFDILKKKYKNYEFHLFMGRTTNEFILGNDVLLLYMK